MPINVDENLRGIAERINEINSEVTQDVLRKILVELQLLNNRIDYIEAQEK